MRKYDKAFVIATSCILKHSSLHNENEVSGVKLGLVKVLSFLFNFAMCVLEKALSWNVQTPPEKRNLLGWTLIGTRKTLHPFPVSLRVIWVLFDTELPVWSWSYWWRLAFVIQKALAGDENVNIRQSKKPNLLGPYWKLQHSVFFLQKLAQVSAEACSSLFALCGFACGANTKYPSIPG